MARGLLRIVEDDAERVPLARAQPADTVTKIDTIDAARSLNRPVVHGEHHTIAASKGDDLGTGLHPRTLLRQDELAAAEVPAGLGEQDCHLEGKCELTVQVLM